jgi:hypothetical protein
VRGKPARFSVDFALRNGAAEVPLWRAARTFEQLRTVKAL